MLKKGIALRNVKEIESWLDDVQKRCTARTIDCDDIIAVCKGIEEKLDISKKDLNGTTVSANVNFQGFAASYQGYPRATFFTAKYSSSTGWRVYEIERRICNNSIGRVVLSDSAKEAVLKKIAHGDWMNAYYLQELEKLQE